MQTIPLEEAQGHLAEIIEKLVPGEEVELTDNGEPLARLVKSGRSSWPCKAGSAKDKILWIAPDFDAPLEEFVAVRRESVTMEWTNGCPARSPCFHER
jgi:prevent-host-death family protein